MGACRSADSARNVGNSADKAPNSEKGRPTSQGSGAQDKSILSNGSAEADEVGVRDAELEGKIRERLHDLMKNVAVDDNHENDQETNHVGTSSSEKIVGVLGGLCKQCDTLAASQSKLSDQLQRHIKIIVRQVENLEDNVRYLDHIYRDSQAMPQNTDDEKLKAGDEPCMDIDQFDNEIDNPYEARAPVLISDIKLQEHASKKKKTRGQTYSADGLRTVEQRLAESLLNMDSRLGALEDDGLKTMEQRFAESFLNMDSRIGALEEASTAASESSKLINLDVRLGAIEASSQSTTAWLSTLQLRITEEVDMRITSVDMRLEKLERPQKNSSDQLAATEQRFAEAWLNVDRRLAGLATLQAQVTDQLTNFANRLGNLERDAASSPDPFGVIATPDKVASPIADLLRIRSRSSDSGKFKEEYGDRTNSNS